MRVIVEAGSRELILSTVLHHHKNWFAENDTISVEKLKKGFSVDDMVTGCSMTDEAFILYNHEKNEGGRISHKKMEK